MFVRTDVSGVCILCNDCFVELVLMVVVVRQEVEFGARCGAGACFEVGAFKLCLGHFTASTVRSSRQRWYKRPSNSLSNASKRNYYSSICTGQRGVLDADKSAVELMTAI